MDIAPGIVVNGIHISSEVINEEVQYHPAQSYFDAKYEAMQSLVIKELLCQEAANNNIAVDVENPDRAIDDLLDKTLEINEPDDKLCAKYYEQNQKRFMTSPLFQVSHILYLAPPEDEEAYEQAKLKADIALKRIQKSPELFSSIAKSESSCSTSGEGGRLGQISKGQTMPMFEAAMLDMNEGDLSNKPVASEVGYHIIRVDKRAEGKLLSYNMVSSKVAEFLKSESWNIAFNEYIHTLADKAKISGFKLKSAR